jgi:hypothetical protein
MKKLFLSLAFIAIFLLAGCGSSTVSNEIQTGYPKSNVNSLINSIEKDNAPPVNSDTSENCDIKGNISSSGEKIYHSPGCASYSRTVIDTSAGERWFCSESEAESAGWRKAKNCP